MTLHIVPHLLSDTADPDMTFVPAIAPILKNVKGFIVETPKEARKFLKCFDFNALRDLPMISYSRKNLNQPSEILSEIKDNEEWVLLSDAGLCCLADPGARLVQEAYKQNITVRIYPGPSSIVLALMYSGFNAQQFLFAGYFPRKITPALHKNITQIFIQTPYKNRATIEDLIQHLKPHIRLCIAVDLMAKTQAIHIHTIKEWQSKQTLINSLNKRPCVFVLEG